MMLNCTNCGGEVPIIEESEFVRCGFCGVDLYVEIERTVTHSYLDFEIEEKDCLAYLKKRLAEMELAGEVSVHHLEPRYFTYWCFEKAECKGAMVCAEPVPMQDMAKMDIPPGKPKVLGKERGEQYAHGNGRDTRKKMDQALAEYFSDKGLETTGDISAKLLETPIYLIEYKYQGNPYEAVVDGITGNIHADRWPPSNEGRKNRVLGGTALVVGGVFLLESVVVPSLLMTLLAYGFTTAVAYHYIMRKLKKMGW